MMEEKNKERRVSPAVLTVALLDEVAERLLTIQKLAEEQRAEGVVEPIEPVAVVATPRRVLAPFKPWFSITIVNDGPNDVKALVNTETGLDWHKIVKDETFKVEVNRGILKDVLLKCEPNENASVRIVGSR